MQSIGDTGTGAWLTANVNGQRPTLTVSSVYPNNTQSPYNMQSLSNALGNFKTVDIRTLPAATYHQIVGNHQETVSPVAVPYPTDNTNTTDTTNSELTKVLIGALLEKKLEKARDRSHTPDRRRRSRSHSRGRKHSHSPRRKHSHSPRRKHDYGDEEDTTIVTKIVGGKESHCAGHCNCCKHDHHRGRPRAAELPSFPAPAAQPVYAAPQPVYAAPAPQPVYAAPAPQPVYAEPPYVQQPMYAEPTYYAAPQPMYAAAPQPVYAEPTYAAPRPAVQYTDYSAQYAGPYTYGSYDRY